MFERFTDRARQTLMLAQEEARAFGHNYIGTEHLLLGLVVEGDGVAAQVLRGAGVDAELVRRRIGEIIGGPDQPGLDDAAALATIGIDLDEVTAAVEAAFGAGALDRRKPKGRSGPGSPPFVPRAKKTLELALREALALGHKYIGTEHLLLGLLRLGEGVAYEILRTHLGGSPQQLRDKVIEELQRYRPGA